MDLKDKVIVVTGASRGIGAATATGLGALGAKLVCAARTLNESDGAPLPGTLEETVAKVKAAGGDAIAVKTDVSSPDDMIGLIGATVAHYGRIDALVNNAAGGSEGGTSLDDFDLRAAHRSVDGQLFSPLLAIKEAVKHFRSQGEGRILNVGSLQALYYRERRMMYGITKIALERLTVEVGEELKDDNIACNLFRIDMPVASSGFAPGSPMAERYGDYMEPCETAADAMIWMLQQPTSYTCQCESMKLMAERSVMQLRAKKEWKGGGAPYHYAWPR